MADIMKARLQTPVDDAGHRDDIHLITDVDAVVYDDQTTLKEYLDRIQGVVNSNKHALAKAGGIYLATTGSELGTSANILFAEIINCTETSIDTKHRGQNRAAKGSVDYIYTTIDPVEIADLTDEEKVDAGYKEVVSVTGLAENEREFDSLLMINIEDLKAYDSTQVWYTGTWIKKEAVSSESE